MLVSAIVVSVAPVLVVPGFVIVQSFDVARLSLVVGCHPVQATRGILVGNPRCMYLGSVRARSAASRSLRSGSRGSVEHVLPRLLLLLECFSRG